MAQRKNAKGGGGNSSSSGSGGSSTSAGSGSGSGSSSSSPGARRETKRGGHKDGRKGGLSGSSFFTWFMVIALLGVWTSVAVVWFDLVDYEEVLAKAKDFRYNLSEVLQGKLGIYDADGDGDFDVDDAKVLLGLKEKSASEPTVPPEEAEPLVEPEEQAPLGTGEDLQPEEDGLPGEPQPEDDFLTAGDMDEQFETLEPGTVPEETEDSYHVEETVSQDYTQDMEELVYEQEGPDSSEPVVDDEKLQHDTDDITYQDYDEQVYEPSENEGIEISDAIADSNMISEEVSVPTAEDQQDGQEVSPDT